MPEPLTDEELTAFEAEAARWPKSNALAISTLLLAAGLRELREAVGPALQAQDAVSAHVSGCSACGGVFGMCERGLGLWREAHRQLGGLRRLAACLPQRGE